MDSKLILVTGGARSGKSSFSERLILENCRRPAYVATCPVLDAETAERIRLHRARREAGNWITVEEETNLAAAFDRAEAARADGVLVALDQQPAVPQPGVQRTGDARNARGTPAANALFSRPGGAGAE